MVQQVIWKADRVSEGAQQMFKKMGLITLT